MRSISSCMAVLLAAVTLLAPVASAQTVSVDGGFIAIWQDLTNYTPDSDRIPKTYRFAVCRVIPSDEMLGGLRDFGYTACPTPLDAPSIPGRFTLILHDFETGNLDSMGRLNVRFVVERTDGTEQVLREFSDQQGQAGGQVPWASMELEKDDLIVAHLRVEGAAIRRLLREQAILLVSLGS